MTGLLTRGTGPTEKLAGALKEALSKTAAGPVKRDDHFPPRTSGGESS